MPGVHCIKVCLNKSDIHIRLTGKCVYNKKNNSRVDRNIETKQHTLIWETHFCFVAAYATD